MRLLLVAGLLVSAAVQAQTAQWIQCPLNGISYALMPPTTWQQAEQSAITAGGHLATVRDANIQAWLVQTFASAAAPDTRIWIGLSDAVTEGTWTWASGEPLSFTNWGLWEPDNNGDQDHGALWLVPPGFGGGWFWCDDNGSNLHSSIIDNGPPGPAAAYATFGAGCPGVGALVPALDGVAAEPPRIGTTTRMRVTNLPLQVTVPIFVLGVSNTSSGGSIVYPLPFDLTTLGWPGCQQFVSLDSTALAITTIGEADHVLTVPFNHALAGFVFHAQAFVLYHPSAVAVSNGLTGTVGY